MHANLPGYFRTIKYSYRNEYNSKYFDNRKATREINIGQCFLLWKVNPQILKNKSGPHPA